MPEVCGVEIPWLNARVEHDVVDWADTAFKPELFGDRFNFDLVVAGFPCQDLSSAFRVGAGLAGARSSLFFEVWAVICKLRRVNPDLDFVLECVDFRKKHPLDFRLVEEVTKVEPVVLCASEISACFQRRAFWMSFDVSPLVKCTVLPTAVLEAGRWTNERWLPTVMASGIYSWNTSQVVFDAGVGEEFGRVPLRTSEMERAMGMPSGFTAQPGLSDKQRHHMIGNSFHVGVIEHIFRWRILHLQAWDETLGYPGEGPDGHARRRQINKRFEKLNAGGGGSKAGKQIGNAACVIVGNGSKVEGVRQTAPARGKKGRTAWRSNFPTIAQTCEGVNLSRVWELNGWSDPKRLILLAHAAKRSRPNVVKGAGFKEWLHKAQHDLIRSSRAESTWRAYSA